MNEKDLKNTLARLKDISIVVIGDFFLDKYLQIDRSRDELSLETDLTAYQVVETQPHPGAAGTVASNFKALGIGSVAALGFIGNDGQGYDLINGLNGSGVITKYLVEAEDRVTPAYIKPVFMKNSKIIEMNRFDIKNWKPTSHYLEKKIIEILNFLAETADAVVVLDQVAEKNCGVITEKVRKVLCGLVSESKKLIVYVDSRANTAMFHNVIIKCNHYEAVKAVMPEAKEEPDLQIIREAGHILSKKTGKPVFVTYGKNGQLLFDNDKFEVIPAVPAKGPFDKCGAGDTATSGIVSALCCKSSLSDAALLGNIVSSITIQQLGKTGTASPQQVLERFMESFNTNVLCEPDKK